MISNVIPNHKHMCSTIRASLVEQPPLRVLCIWNPVNPQATASGKGIRSLLFFPRPLQMQCRICSSPSQRSREYTDCCQALYSRTTYKPGKIKGCGTIALPCPRADSRWPAVLEMAATCLPFQGCHNATRQNVF